ncbi:MAG: DUF885 family protein [Balneolaceae bacterium]
MKKSLVNLLFFSMLLAGCATQGVTQPASSDTQEANTHEALVELYEEFRSFRFPEVNDGIPDYTPEAMERQYSGLQQMQQRLAAIDTTGWPIAEQVDYRVVEGEMRGLEFEHIAKKSWERDPAFYAVINYQFGPKMHMSLSLPGGSVSDQNASQLETRLEAIPRILEQARVNLTDPIADHAYIAIYTTQRQIGRVESFIDSNSDRASLVQAAEGARDAIVEYRQWLIDTRPSMRNGAGVGEEMYDWYLEHVAMLPYTWQELVTLSQREYERAVAGMNLMKHRYRHSPKLEPAQSREEYVERYNNALAHYYRFLNSVELFTVPDFIEPVGPVSNWNRSGETDYFAHVLDRYPLPLSAHGRGHDYDAMFKARDDRPIRGQSRLYFLDGVRQEAFAIGQEKFHYYLGLVDDVPGAHEVMYNLKAFRAARAVADLKMHSNEMTFEEAWDYVVDATPYDWIPEDSPTLWHDLELYMHSPLYGVGYVVGPIQIEKLMTEVFMERGEEFNLTEFMDEFLAASPIPLSLISLEMLGRTQH